MNFEKVVALCPQEVIALEPLPMIGSETEHVVSLAEDAVEELVVCLAAVEASWASGEFNRLGGLLVSLMEQANRAGFPQVVQVAKEVDGLLTGRDEVALAAVIARLIRVGETSLATLLEISYLQV
ncbi:MAG: hypothetical protein AAFR73_09015 [Pseudomonadota bacterium]